MIRLLIATCAALLLTACSDYTDAQIEALDAVASGAMLIDVRSPKEFASGHMPGAINIPHTEIVDGISKLNVNPDTPIVLYCRSGNRSGQATASLAKAGFSQLTNAGGLESLKAAAALRAQRAKQ